MSIKRINWWWWRNESGDYFVVGASPNGRQEFGSTEGYRRKGRAIANAVLFGAPPELRDVAAYEVIRIKHRVVKGRLC